MKEAAKTIGTLAVDTPIVMPPMGTYRCTEDGFVTDEVVAYYRKRAENPHVGLIITEHSYVQKQGKAKARQMSIAEDACIPGLTRLVEAIHRGGAKAFAQLNHGGSACPPAVTGLPVVAPSAVVLPVHPPVGDGTLPAELTEAQIAEIVRAFAAAAVRAKKAGYDGVEIHSAHGYLLNQFFSPLTNHRTDEYGGSLENRLRLHRAVIRAVRDAVGPGYPITLRLGASDYAPGGNTLEDGVAAARLLAREDIQLLNVTGGMNRYTVPGHSEPGYFAPLSGAIREAVSLPVMVTGGVKTLADAQALLDSGAADFIGVGRALLKDGDWEI